MLRHWNAGLMLFAAIVVMPSLASRGWAQKQQAGAEDPNDKAQMERDFEQTRKHMQLHSEWSKKSGKMSDN